MKPSPRLSAIVQVIVCVASGLIASFMALQPLASAAWSTLFISESGSPVVESVLKGSPVPRALAWSSGMEAFLRQIGNLLPALVLLWHILCWLIALYILLKLLNPGFRLTSGVDMGIHLFTRTYLYTPPLIKAFLIGVTAFLPIFIIWQIILWIPLPLDVSLLICMIFLGVALWTLFSEDGVAGDYDSGNYIFPSKASLKSFLLRGALAGVAGWLAFICAKAMDPSQCIRFFLSLGGIGENVFRQILWLELGGAAWIGAGLGGFLAALAVPEMPYSRRLRHMLFPFLMLLAAWGISALLPSWQYQHFDYSPGMSKISQDALMAEKTGAPLSSAGTMRMILRTRMGDMLLQSPLQTVNGEPADALSRDALMKYLNKRGYRTALSFPLFTSLHDMASLDWDSEASLRLDYDKICRSPDQTSAKLFLEKILSCADSSIVLKWLDMMESGNQFVYPDRDSLVLMGDLYARAGNSTQAESWYRRANLPNALDRVNSHTLYASATLDGRIFEDGKPLQGMRIGLVPMNAMLPKEMIFLPDGSLSPYWLRWVAASAFSNARGSFKMQHLISGRYYLILSDGNWKRDQIVQILSQWKDAEIFVSPSTKKTHLGNILLHGVNISSNKPPLVHTAFPLSSH
jgi:hypothetical protein